MASRSIARPDRLTIRAYGRLSTLVLVLFLCLPLHLTWRLFSRSTPIPSLFLGLAGRAMGLRVTREGQPLPSHVLFIANHISWLDILALGGATGTAFVSKADVKRWPFVGWLAGLNDTVYVEREDRRSVKGQASALGSALCQGKPVTLFPEGTTGPGDRLLPFRASLFAAVAPPPAGVRVQPVVLDYGRNARDIAWTDGEGAAANARRLFNRTGPIHVRIIFLEPLTEEALDDRKAIAAQTQSAIADRLGAPSRLPGTGV